MTRPAEEPGTPLEPSGNCRPREMVTHDRIRLTGLLRRKPWQQGFLYMGRNTTSIDVPFPGDERSEKTPWIEAARDRMFLSP